MVALVRGDQARIRLMDFVVDGDDQEPDASRVPGVAGDTTGNV